MRPDIETRPLLVKDVAMRLLEISQQKPDATLAVRDQEYGCLVDDVTYDPDTNEAVIEIVMDY
jgi:hypothetical protein